VLVPMFMSMFDLGSAIYQTMVLRHAVRAGALYALYYNNTGGVQTVMTGSMPASWTNVTINITLPSSCICMSLNGTYASVSCTGSCSNGATLEKMGTVSASRPFSPMIISAITQVSASDVIRYQ